MAAPKYKSRFTYNNVVVVELPDGQKIKGTVRAVKFTEASVFYDVQSGDQYIPNVPSMAVVRDESEFDKDVTTV